MSILAAKAFGKYRHPAFAGLSEKALNAVYSAGRIDTLSVGTFLFEQGQPLAETVLVLDGAGEILIVVEQQVVPLLRIGRGAHVPAQSADGPSHTAALIVTATLSVFRIAPAVIDDLDPDVQLVLHRNLFKLASVGTARLLAATTDLARRSHALLGSVSSFLATRNSLYSESAAIRALLQKMPRLPPYASELTSMLISDKASTRDVVNMARLDPSLTGTVLKAVNSAAFGLRHKVVDFQHAFVLLGFNQIYQIIIHKGINSTMPKTAEFQQLQFHSMMISVLSFEISHAVKQGHPALLSTIGLLHDIGKSVILLLKRQHPQMAFLINLLDPGMIGALLLREWEIPVEVTRVIEYLGHAELVPPHGVPAEHRSNMAILFLAHCCFDYMTDKEPADAHAAFFADHLRALELPPCTLADFVRNTLVPSIAARNSTQPVFIRNYLNKLDREPPQLAALGC